MKKILILAIAILTITGKVFAQAQLDQTQPSQPVTQEQLDSFKAVILADIQLRDKKIEDINKKLSGTGKSVTTVKKGLDSLGREVDDYFTDTKDSLNNLNQRQLALAKHVKDSLAESRNYTNQQVLATEQKIKKGGTFWIWASISILLLLVIIAMIMAKGKAVGKKELTVSAVSQMIEQTVNNKLDVKIANLKTQLKAELLQSASGPFQANKAS